MPSPSVAEIRRTYAGEMLLATGIESDPRLLEAFATVPREAFLGDPPWLLGGAGFGAIPSTRDPRDIYRDVLVALDPLRGINNGSPVLHAAALHALAVQPGETIVHIGAGTGYYSAILAELAGPSGHVVAVEFEPALAERARHCLGNYPTVELVEGNGADWPREPVDIVYVNFAVDRPADNWIEMLKPGGRLLFPLGVPADSLHDGGPAYSDEAGYLMVTNTPNGYAARFLERVAFIWSQAIPRADPQSHSRLAAALKRGGGTRFVRSLRWKTTPKADEWYSGGDWGLSVDPPSKPD